MSQNGALPRVAIVSGVEQHRFALALRSGLELVGLTVLLADSPGEIAASGLPYEHLIVGGTVDPAQFTALPRATPDHPGSGSGSSGTAHLKDAAQWPQYRYPLADSTEIELRKASLSLLANAISWGARTIEMAPAPETSAAYRLVATRERDAGAATGPTTETSTMDATRARALIATLEEMAAPLPGSLETAANMLLLHLANRWYEVHVDVSERENGSPRAEITARPLVTKQRSMFRPDGSSEISFSGGASEQGDAPIIRIVNQIHQQALREGAHHLSLVPDEHHVKVCFAVGQYRFEIMAVPMHIREPLTQRLRLMADLYLANRKVVQHGTYRVTFEGMDYDADVTFVPGRLGERVEIALRDPGAAGDAHVSGADPSSAAAGLPLDGKLVLLVGNDHIDTTLHERWASQGARAVIATTEPADLPARLLFTLMFYRALVRQGDERAAFKKAKTAVFAGEQIKLFE